MDRKKVRQTLGKVALGVILFTQTTFASGYGNVNVSNLNVRTNSNTNSNIIKQIGTSNYLRIIDKAENGWYAIETDSSKLGYVSAQYVDIQKARGIVSANNVNIRQSPDYSAAIVSKLGKNQVVYAHAQAGDWFLIKTGNIKGYIHRDFVDGLLIDRLPNKKAASGTTQTVVISEPAEKTIAVAKTTINLRQGPSTDTNIVGKVTPSTVVDVNKIESDWVKVTMSDSKEGYLAKEYLNIGKESALASLIEGITSNNNSNNKADDIINYAKRFLGNPYIYGGNSLTDGIDCSGFTSQVFKEFGVLLNRNSAAQYANNGTHVSSSDARPGDLMFYGYDGNVSHVGIYIGNGQIVHASTPSTGIIIGNAFRTTGKPLIGVKRVL